MPTPKVFDGSSVACFARFESFAAGRWNRAPIHIPRLDPDLTRTRNGFDRVQAQIHHDLVDLSRIRKGIPKPFLEIAHQFNPMRNRAGLEPEYIDKRIVEIHHPGLILTSARIGQKMLRQATGPLGRVADIR